MQSQAKTTVAYLKEQLPERRAALETVRQWIRDELPKAKESMGMKMPTWEIGDETAVALAGQKHYMALYVCATDVLARHGKAFAHLDVGKSCIRFKRLEDLSERDVRRVLRETGKRVG